MKATETIFLASSIVYWPRRDIYPLFCQLYSFDLSVVLHEFFLNTHTFTMPWILQTLRFSNLTCLLYLCHCCSSPSLAWNSSCFRFQNLPQSCFPQIHTPQWCHWDAARMQTCSFLLKNFLVIVCSLQKAQVCSNGRPLGHHFLPPLCHTSPHNMG